MLNLNTLRRTLFVLAAFSTPTWAANAFHVSPKGNDTAAGSADQPFATLERAREAVRKAGAAGPRSVVVHGGDYEIAGTLALGRQDSGGEGDPVVWSAAAGEIVRLIGGKTVPAGAFKPVQDAATLVVAIPVARPSRFLGD